MGKRDFEPGYKRRRWTYSFRAYVDLRGSNLDRFHRGVKGSGHHCDCLKLWDLNWRKNSHNIIRITRGRGHFVILLGRKYRKIAIRQRKWMYA